MKLGDTYHLPYCDQTVILVRIIDKEAGKKLNEPLYEWAYADNENRRFKNKIRDIEIGLKFKLWMKN